MRPLGFWRGGLSNHKLDKILLNLLIAKMAKEILLSAMNSLQRGTPTSGTARWVSVVFLLKSHKTDTQKRVGHTQMGRILLQGPS